MRRRRRRTGVGLSCLGVYLNGLGECMQMDFVKQVRCVCFLVRSVLKKVDLVMAESGCGGKARFRVVCLYGNTCMLFIEPDDDDDESRVLLLTLDFKQMLY